MPDTSTNAALAATGYITAPSPSYGLKRILRDGVEVGHFDCQTAWDLPGMREYRARLADPAVQRQMAELQRLFDAHRARKSIPVPDVTPERALADLARAVDLATA